MLVAIPALSNARARAQRIRCISYLKQQSLGFRIWANDHKERFPWEVHVREGGIVPDAHEIGESFGGVLNAFRAVSNELNMPTPLLCLRDASGIRSDSFDRSGRRPFGGTEQSPEPRHLSYFAGWDADEIRPDRLLTGDSHLYELLAAGEGDPGPAGVVRSYGTNLGVSSLGAIDPSKDRHDGGVNLSLSDGSAHQLNLDQLREHLLKSAETITNRIPRLVFPRR